MTNGKNIYRATLGNILKDGFDQVFYHQQMLPIARWPNVPFEQVTRLTNDLKCRATDGSGYVSSKDGWYESPDLINAPDLTGAKITFSPGPMWDTWCGMVVSHVNNRINIKIPYDYYSFDGNYYPQTANVFYCWDSLNLLDHPGEWFLNQSTKELFLWFPDNATPNDFQIKQRFYSFYLDGISNLNIQNLTLHACTIKTNENSNNLIYDNLKFLYPVHLDNISVIYYTAPDNRGIYFQGNNCTIKNSEIRHVATDTIILNGTNNKAINNYICCVGYSGRGSAIDGGQLSNGGENPGGTAKNQVIQNTIHSCGYQAISIAPGLDIMYNDVYDTHLQNTDTGAITGWKIDGKGAEISYNLVHDAQGDFNVDLRFYGGHGIYLDHLTKNFLVHHNIVWNCTSACIGLMPYDASNPDNAIANCNRKIYHNTTLGIIGYDDNTITPGNEFKNNICLSIDKPSNDKQNFWVCQNNYEYGDHQEPNFFQNKYPGDYTLLATAEAVGYGVYLEGISQSQPVDAGAIQGSLDWIAGATITDYDLANLQISSQLNKLGEFEVIITGLPESRKLPANFHLLIDNVNVAGKVVNFINYQTKVVTAKIIKIKTSGITGIKPISVQIGKGTVVAKGTINFDIALNMISGVQVNSDKSLLIQGQAFPAPNYQAIYKITNPNNQALYNYPILLSLDTKTPISANQMRSDGGDIRCNDNSSELNYWIQQGLNTTSTKIWVNIGKIPIGTSRIYVSWGDSSLVSQSNGSKTFLFFDDFTAPELADYYDICQSGQVKVEKIGQQMVISGTFDPDNLYNQQGFSLNWKFKWPTGKPYAIDSIASIEQNSSPIWGFSVGGFQETIYLFPGDDQLPKIGYYVDGINIVGSSNVSSPTFSQEHFSVGYTDNQVFWLEHNIQKAVRTGYSTTDQYRGVWGFAPNQENVNVKVTVDAIWIRQFTPTQPQVIFDQQQTQKMKVFIDGTESNYTWKSNTVIATGVLSLPPGNHVVKVQYPNNTTYEKAVNIPN